MTERRQREASEEEDGFLNRWSRRKHAARTEPPVTASETAAASDPTAEAVAEQAAPDEGALSDAELLEKHGLPDPRDMKAGDDFSAFMRAGVPARLRRLALRRLWVSNPALANLDELLDYGEDFTDAATVIENLATAYQVGRGFRPAVDEDAPSSEDAACEDAARQDTARQDTLSADAARGDAPEPDVKRDADLARDADLERDADAERETDPEPDASDASIVAPVPVGSAASASSTRPVEAAPQVEPMRPRRMAFRFE